MLTSPSGELLPSDLLVLVLAKLCLVRDIKRVKRTCRAFRDAAPEAEKAHRRVCYVGHTQEVASPRSGRFV